MARISSFELYAVDLPFRKPFKHAAKERWTSESLILKCETESGLTGYGECLPRDYVSGETRDDAFKLLEQQILPRLLGLEFHDLEEVKAFLFECNGKAPAGWACDNIPQTAAWAAVDLALLDAFSREFSTPITLGESSELSPSFRYSVVASTGPGFKYWKTLLLAKAYGFSQIKLKVDRKDPVKRARTARRILGNACDIRVDVNMAWDVPFALATMPQMARYGVRSFEQPLVPDDHEGMARLIRETGLEVMVDESLNDAASLEALIEERACTAVNVRISKCGGLMASYRRCLRALEKGLIVQVGCQVGETSLLSSAQMILIAAVGKVTYGEGCFGHHLLRDDPFQPLMQFGFGGRPPQRSGDMGFGVRPDEKKLLNCVENKVKISPS
jgi:muconate cycloisomerase